jgi:hypothetical protein
MFFNWLTFVGWGAIWFVFFRNFTFLFYTATGSLSIMFWLRGMVYFKLNDFEFFEDVD